MYDTHLRSGLASQNEMTAERQAYIQGQLSQASSFGPPPPESLPSPEIPEKLARIESLMGDVRQMIETLDNRIGPILASSAPSEAACGAARGCKSGLGGVLDAFGDRLELMRSRLSDMVYRIQI